MHDEIRTWSSGLLVWGCCTHDLDPCRL